MTTRRKARDSQRKAKNPLSLWPLTLDQALAGAFQVPVAKKTAKATKRKSKK